MEPVSPKSKPFILFPARSVMRPVVAFALYLTLNVSATGKVPVWFSLNCKYNVSLSENPAGEVGMGPCNCYVCSVGKRACAYAARCAVASGKAGTAVRVVAVVIIAPSRSGLCNFRRFPPRLGSGVRRSIVEKVKFHLIGKA